MISSLAYIQLSGAVALSVVIPIACRTAVNIDGLTIINGNCKGAAVLIVRTGNYKTETKVASFQVTSVIKPFPIGHPTNVLTVGVNVLVVSIARIRSVTVGRIIVACVLAVDIVLIVVLSRDDF